MHVPHFKPWNSRIRSCTLNLHYREALMAFFQMRIAGMKPDCYALSAVIKSCSALSDIALGKSCHGFSVKGGYWPNSPVQKALMDMYARLGMLNESQFIFSLMGLKDSASWNILLSGYARLQFHVQAMRLLCSMHGSNEEEEKPNAITAAIILPICARLGALKPGQTFHGYVAKIGLASDTLVGNSLVSMYAKCGSVTGDARLMFDLIIFKDVVSWNSMISGYTENGFLDEAFGLVSQMVEMGIRMNYATVANVLPICAFLEQGWHRGKEIHCHVLRLGLETDVSVYNALVTYYARAGNLMGAEHVFRHMDCLRDLVTWNTLIAGYAINDWHLRAMELFHELLSSGVEPDSITLVSVLPVCGQLGDIQEGRKIHEYINKHPELRKDTSLGNALVSFYRKCGEFDDAIQTFMGIPEKDLISWNSMLAVFVDSGKVEENLCGLLNQMLTEGNRPDSVTIFSILQACVFLGTRKVRETHGYSIRAGLTGMPTVGNAILDAYAKCGNMESAKKAFESFLGKNVVSSNTMITGYAKHGSQEDAERVFDQMLERDLATWNLMVQIYAENDRIDQAISLFRKLQCQGMRPDTVSIMSVLPVCARLASVHLVRQCHGYTLRALLLHDLRLEGAFLDTYSKCGSINDAFRLFRTNSRKDLCTFTAMIGGYAMHGMGREAIEVFSQMLELDIKPDHVVMTALLSACSHSGLVDEGWKHFNSIDEPKMEHYACVVDLLSRRGRLREAYNFITGMPCEADANVWGTLLGACKIHGEAEIGRLVADRLIEIEAGNIGNYVVMSNIYAAEGRWDGVEKVRRLMKTRDLRKPAGCSWIEVEKKRHVFLAGDLSHPHRLIIYCTLASLVQQIKEPLLLQNSSWQVLCTS